MEEDQVVPDNIQNDNKNNIQNNIQNYNQIVPDINNNNDINENEPDAILDFIDEGLD
jgi:hypothetical protein